MSDRALTVTECLVLFVLVCAATFATLCAIAAAWWLSCAILGR